MDRSLMFCFFFFSSRRRHTRCYRDWSSDVCSSDLGLVGPREDRARRGWLAAVNAISASTFLLQGDTPHAGAGFFLDFSFAIGAPTPEGEGKAIFDGFLQVVVGLRIVGVAFAESQSLVVKRLLDFRQQALDGGGQVGARSTDFSFPAWAVAARQDSGLFGNVLGSEFHAQRDSTHFPVIEFPAGALAFSFIESDPDVDFDQLGLQFARGVEDGGLFFLRLENRDDHNLVRSKLRRQDQALIVAVDHDYGANDAS